MTIREMRQKLEDTQHAFAQRYDIPYRSIQNWESGARIPPEYVVNLLEQRVKTVLVNRRIFKLPVFDQSKIPLPQRTDYLSVRTWLHDVADILGRDTIFALNEALMCNGRFLGRNDEFLIWIYGDDSLARYSGVAVIGNQLPQTDIAETDGLRHTVFTRALNDAMANEHLLDMQGITEALSNYYFSHNESFGGLAPSLAYQDVFFRLAEDAVNYYAN